MRISRIILSFLGLGFLPAGGTFGTIGGLSVYKLTKSRFKWIYFFVFLLFSWILIKSEEKYFEKDDPGWVVLDEVAGIWISMLISKPDNIFSVFRNFIFFRIFDIFKPFPIGMLERLPGATGIMADDLAAGILSGIIEKLLDTVLNAKWVKG